MKRLIASFTALGLIAAPAMAVTTPAKPPVKAAKASKKSAAKLVKAAAAKPASKSN